MFSRPVLYAAMALICLSASACGATSGEEPSSVSVAPQNQGEATVPPPASSAETGDTTAPSTPVASPSQLEQESAETTVSATPPPATEPPATEPPTTELAAGETPVQRVQDESGYSEPDLYLTLQP